jgi:hypothetical protein
VLTLAFGLLALAGFASVYAGAFNGWSLGTGAPGKKDCRASAFAEDLECRSIPWLFYGGTAFLVIGIGGVAYRLTRKPEAG